MNDTLDLATVHDIADEINSPPAFIEKDWYVAQALKRLNSFRHERDIDILFSGGTSLSKGHGIVNRFSEDVDFILSSKDGVSINGRRTYRRAILNHLTADGMFDVDRDKVRRSNENRFFSADMFCDLKLSDDSIRPYVQIEMTFFPHRLPTSTQTVRSLVGEFQGNPPEAEIACISPIEIASDKISALTWRVVVRDRNSKKDDPALVRHLHDLSALKPHIEDNQEQFLECAWQSLEADQKSRGGEVIKAMSVTERLQKAFAMMTEDSTYRDEYEKFVQRMSYANIEEQIHFDTAMESLQFLIDLLLSKPAS